MSLRHPVLNRPDGRGFTLIEIVLALAITAVIMTVVYGSLRGTGRSLASLSVRNQLYRSTYALLEEMGRELASAYLSRNGGRDGRARTLFYVEDRESRGMPQDALYFTTYGHAFSLNRTGESDQSEVCYAARYSEQRGELVLLKKEDLTPDGLTCKDEPLEETDRPLAERPVPVATGIHPRRGLGFKLVGFDVECFGEGEESLKEWDSDEQHQIPRRVRVTLTYEDGNENRYPFSKTVLLRLQEITPTTRPAQGTSSGSPSS